MNKALFIMLDGTLITTKSGKSFPLHCDDWKFTNEFFSLFSTAIARGYTLVIIAEELGIEEGFVKEKLYLKKLDNICKTIEKELGIKKGKVLYNYCGGTYDEFRTLKYPGMLYEIANDNNIILTQSVLIGNSIEDELFSSIGGISQYYNLHQLNYILL